MSADSFPARSGLRTPWFALAYFCVGMVLGVATFALQGRSIGLQPLQQQAALVLDPHLQPQQPQQEVALPVPGDMPAVRVWGNSEQPEQQHSEPQPGDMPPVRVWGSSEGGIEVALPEPPPPPAAPPSPPPPPPPRPSPPLHPCQPHTLQSLLPSGAAVWVEPPEVPPEVLSEEAPYMELAGAGCALRRVSVQDARSCLAGETVLFIGDSLTRYQYVDFAMFMEHAKWPWPMTMIAHKDIPPSPMWEADFQTWPEYYAGSNAALNGHELCDCARCPEGCTMMENRFYANHGLDVQYWQFFTHDISLRGHKEYPPFNQNPSARCAPGNCTEPPDWDYDLPGALEHVISQQKPTVIVFNSGIWGSVNNFREGYVEDVFAAAGKAAAASGRTKALIYKTTTEIQYGNRLLFSNFTEDHDRAALEAAERHGWRVMDARRLTEPLQEVRTQAWVDLFHFHPFVYSELNNYLLNMLCGA